MNNTQIIQQIKVSTYLYWLSILSVVSLGVYFRLILIGNWPLALDEYYIIRSVQLILEKGIPEFDVGGYYSRGLFFQYILASFQLFGLKIEIISRIVPVFANILAFPALYLLTKKYTNKTISFIIILFFSLSLWEIEYSRFIRMYTFFQTIFIWYLYFLDRVLFDNNSKAIKWIWFLSAFSIFVYEASIFIVLLNFLVPFWDKEQKRFEFSFYQIGTKKKQILVSSIIFIIAYFYLSFDFRTLGANNLLPLELEKYFSNTQNTSSFRLPMVLLSYSQNTLFGVVFFILTFIPTSITTFLLIRKKSLDPQTKLSASILILLSFLNLYGLLIISIIFILLLKIWDSSKMNELKLFMVITIFSNIVFQNIFALINLEWYQHTNYLLGTGIISSLKVLWKEFINYPNFYELYALFRDIYKWHTLFSLLVLIFGLVIILIKKEKMLNAKQVTFSILVLLTFFVTFLNTQYFETRYFFFLYPLFLICFFYSVYEICRLFTKQEFLNNIIVIAFSLFFFLISEDISANHLLNIDQNDVYYRKNMSTELRDHFYPRWDSRTIAQIVNSESKPNDFIISNEQISSYYLIKLDYLYRNYKSNDFKIESADNGKTERWTNSKLIYTYKELIKVLSDTERQKWLIINKTYIHELEEKDFFKIIDKYFYYVCDDGTSYIYKIPATFNQ